MKITKVKTCMGELGSPVTTELETIVERMRSETTKAAAQRIAQNALAGRLAADEGAGSFMLGGADALPYLVFSATFGRSGFSQPTALTGLLLLSIRCPEGGRQVAEMRRRASQVPYTLLAFAGVSGVTLKVVVRCRYDGPADEADYLAFMREARQCGTDLYGALLHCDFYVAEPALWRGCRMSYDPQLCYQPEAQPMPVVVKSSDPLAPYEGTHADDDGRVTHHPDDDERQRLLMEFQTCLAKAIDESVGEPEHCLQLLADYCAKAHLPEEGCTVRAGWVSRFRTIGTDVVRKTFRNAYKKPLGDCPLSQMNEKERIIRSIEGFLTRRYQLRFNVVKQQREFRPNDLHFRDWRPLTDRELKSIVVEEMKEGGESWMNDLRTYIESAHISDYNPVHEFLAGCGRWDGRRNYIEDFARYLTTDYADWPRYFHRWFLAMVAQALNLSRDYGNSMVPLLIGTQGVRKSTFCKNILPPAMREYYMDDIKMDNAEQVERVLGRMWLVCIDEYNAKTPREQAKIKRLLTEKDVQVRRMRSDQYTMTPRLCSFIATTNDPTPLPADDGSRRYLCVEVTGEAKLPPTIPYRQMYAQAVSELEDGALYWFTSDDERSIQEHNRRYQQHSSVEQVLSALFAPAPEHRRRYFWQVLDIQKELEKHLKKSDVPTLKAIGQTLKALRWPRGGIKGQNGYYLTLRTASADRG